MPVWHEAMQALGERDDVVMVGLIQEQHPDRCRLFMQWKAMGWPVMVDPLNLLGVSVVPIHALLDEAGVVRAMPRPRGPEATRAALEAFAARPPVEPGAPPRSAARPNLEALANAAARGGAAALARYADALALWGEDADLSAAIDAYQRALEEHPDDATLRFRLGVAHRMRFDAPTRQPGDFAAAVRHWRAALDADPNQYIWRRRIQQYGPRLDKPYAFYDWVREARRELEARGEEPLPLRVEPAGAELALPSERFPTEEPAASGAARPDPEGRVHRDERGYVSAEVVQVDHSDPDGRAARVHVILTPAADQGAHWNNEAEPLTLWVDPPDGWQVSARRLVHPNPTHAAATTETRQLELELLPPDGLEAGRYVIPAYALYNVCEGPDGVCLYRRQQLDLTVTVGQAEAR